MARQSVESPRRIAEKRSDQKAQGQAITEFFLVNPARRGIVWYVLRVENLPQLYPTLNVCLISMKQRRALF